MKKQFIISAAILISIFCNQAISSENQGFKVKQDANGQFWFIDPQGHSFLSIGINNIIPSPWNPRPNTDYYDPVKTIFGGDYNNWKQDIYSILNKNGFNTLGAWSDPCLYGNQIYGTICLYIASYAADRCLEGFKPDFEKRIIENAKEILSKYKNLDNVIGFYLDNEMPWYGKSPWDDIPNYTLLETAVELPGSHSARQAAIQFLKSRYNSLASFNEAWGANISKWDDVNTVVLRRCQNDKTQKDRADFTSLAAEKFFAAACKVVRQLAPGKLILGVRFAGHAPTGVIEACGKYCDVLSFNNYQTSPNVNERMLANYYILSGKKPLMVTEYSWRAKENNSGNPNTGGGGAVVQTQAQRAANYKTYVETMFSYPMVIGAHWFEFADQSPQGRFDGENSNYGIVDIKHRPYSELLNSMAQSNAILNKIHSESPVKEFKSLPQQAKVVFDSVNRPEKPPMLDLMKCEHVQEPALFYAPDASASIKQEANFITIEYNTGNNWGCGIMYFGPKTYSLNKGPSFAADLTGYKGIEIDFNLPKNISYEIIIDEAGVAETSSAKYNTEAGDDGESFAFKPISGTGKRETVKLNFNELLIRKTWGNQTGAKKIDLNAIKGIGIYLHGGQGKGQIDLHSFALVK